VVVSRLNIWNLPRLFRIKVKVIVRLRIGGTPPYREWEHNASLSSLNSKKKLRNECLLGGCMGSTECRSFCYFFLSKTQSPEKWSFSVLDLPNFLILKSGGRQPF